MEELATTPTPDPQGITRKADGTFAKGTSGNPKGTRSLENIINNVINALGDSNPSEACLRAIAKDKTEGIQRRVAARRLLLMLEQADMADFEPYLEGDANLRELRGNGLNTEVIKKVKTKSRVVPIPGGHGTTEEVIEREIELHDRDGVEFDRVLDRVSEKQAGPTVQIGTDNVNLVLVHTAPPPPAKADTFDVTKSVQDNEAAK